MTKICLTFILSLLFIGCASTGLNRGAQDKLLVLTSQAKYQEAIKLVKSKKFFPEKRSSLLKKLELGSLYYLKGDYYKALKTLDKAKDISDKLYTQSLSKKVAAALVNANQDNYYGERFERSLLRFYLSLIHFNLYLKGEYEGYKLTSKKIIPSQKLSLKQRRQHLFAARAMILEWDSLLENYKQDIAGISSYKTDLMAKILGALIHEQIGTRTDLNIAKQLYKDAKKVLFQNYNLYPTFNSKYKNYAKDYKKLPNLSRAKVEKEYIEQTEYAKDLVQYVDQRLMNLNARNGQKDNIKILLKTGFVAKKIPKKIDFPLPVVRLGYVSGKETDLFVFTLEMLAISRGTRPSISYELPGIEQKKQDKKHYAVIKNKKGVEIKRQKLVLVNPMSDIAAQTMESDYASEKTAIGLRVAGKHVAAILAAYKIYKAQPNAFGKVAAGLAYAAANKAIAASEKVDLRQWTTLPHNIQMSSFSLVPGQEYIIDIEEIYGKKKTIVETKKIKIQKNQIHFLDLNIL